MTVIQSKTASAGTEPGVRSKTGRRAGGSRVWLARLAALVVLLLIWQLVSMLLGGETVPPPLNVLTSLGELIRDAAFWSAVGQTLASTLVGLAIACAVGIPLGLLVGSSRFATASTRLPVDFLRTIPPVTLIPLAVLVYGPNISMKVFLVVFGSIWPLFLQATYAVREVDLVARDVGRAFNLQRSTVWTSILLPSAAPFLLTGLRVASTIALLLSVAGELIGNAPGIGREIVNAQTANQPSITYAYVVVAALLGVAINLVTASAQKRTLFWHPSFRSGMAR